MKFVSQDPPGWLVQRRKGMAMMQRIRYLMNRDEGFTLIELLIVIVILGILAAIVVFSVNGLTSRGQTSACKADVTTVTVASEAYFAQYGSYATSMGGASPNLLGFLHSAPTDVSYSGGGSTAPTIAGIGC